MALTDAHKLITAICLLTFAILLIDAQTVNRPCQYNSNCNRNEQCTLAPGFSVNSRICTCRLGFELDRNLEVCIEQSNVGFESRPCETNSDCSALEECIPLINTDQEAGSICACSWNRVFDRQLNACRAVQCEEWCYTSYGDTCRNDRCHQCWAGGFFTCNQFLSNHNPPPSLIITQTGPSFISIWIMSFFFLMATVVLISCVWKCCTYTKKPTVRRPTAVRSEFPVQPHVVHDTSAHIKMPLDGDLPPPYPSNSQPGSS